MQHHGTYCLCASPSLHDHTSVHCKNVHTKGVPQSKYIIWILIETQNLDLLMYIMEWEKKIHVFKKYISSQTCDFPYFPDNNSFFWKKKCTFSIWKQRKCFFSLKHDLVSDCLTFYSTHFVCFVWSANNFAQKQKRKTLTAPDVFEALEEMEFEQFIKPLKESLECEYWKSAMWVPPTRE